MPVKMTPGNFEVEESDEWWFKRLFDAFFERSKRRDVIKTRPQWAEYMWGWYIGDPELPEHATDWQQQITRDVLRMGRANLTQLAVESKLDRLQVTAIRTKGEAGDDDGVSVAESVADKLMEKYGTVFDDAALYASVMNDGYIWVGGPGRDGLPIVTAEDPRNCVTIDDPVDPNTSIAAMKLYHDKLRGYDYAHVVLPAYSYLNDDGEEVNVGTRVRVACKKTSVGMSPHFRIGAWEWDDENKSREYPTSAQGRGTLVHHVTAPNGVGDVEPHLDLAARINNMIVDRLWISKFQVFRQRAFQDTETDPDADDPFPDEDEDGNEIDWDKELQADPGAMWRLPAGVKIWESTPTDLQGALLAVRDDIKEFSAATRTPMYVFTPDAIQGSAAGADLASETAVAKAEKWQKRLVRVFVAAAKDMLAVAGQAAAADEGVELGWGPIKRVSMNESTNAGTQAKAAGVPAQGVWEDYLQATPAQIKRWKKYRSADLLFQTPSEPAPNRPADVQTPPPPPAPPDPVEDFINQPPAPRESAGV